MDHKAQLDQMCALFGTPKESNWPEAYDLALEKEYRFPIQAQKATGVRVDPVNLSKTLTHTTEEALDLIYKMCMMHPKFRFSAEECLKHPYFENLAVNDEKEEISPTYFMNKDFYHPDYDPRVFYRNKIKEQYKKDWGNVYKHFVSKSQEFKSCYDINKLFFKFRGRDENS